MANGSLDLSTDFYDAFSIEGTANLRLDALAQFRLEAERVCNSCCSASYATARRDRVPPGVISPSKGEEEQGAEEEETSVTIPPALPSPKIVISMGSC